MSFSAKFRSKTRAHQKNWQIGRLKKFPYLTIGPLGNPIFIKRLNQDSNKKGHIKKVPSQNIILQPIKGWLTAQQQQENIGNQKLT